MCLSLNKPINSLHISILIPGNQKENMQLFNSNSFVQQRRMCYMQGITVHMWLPIKSHADWQHCIFLIRKKSMDSCGGCSAYRTSLTDHVSVASCSTFSKSKLIIYKLWYTYHLADLWCATGKEKQTTEILQFCPTVDPVSLACF